MNPCKRLATPMVALGIVALTCACSPSASAESDYRPPEVRAASDGEEEYVDAPSYDAKSAESVNPALGPPEAAVIKFLASRARGDSSWKDAIAPKALGDDRTQRSLDEWSEWKLTEFQLRKRQPAGGGGLYITVRFQIDIDGDSDGGEDEFTVENIDGVWMVTSVPS